MPRYLSLVQIDERTAPAEGPSPELMQRMGELIEEITKAGVMLQTEGLTPSAQGKRVHYSGGELSVTDVCMQVGCTSLGSFSSRFTELMGETPSEYRARSHDERSGIPSCVAKQADRPTRARAGRSGSEKREPVPGA